MGCNTRSVAQVELTAQGDDAQAIAATDAEIYAKHGLAGTLVTTEARVRVFSLNPSINAPGYR